MPRSSGRLPGAKLSRPVVHVRLRFFAGLRPVRATGPFVVDVQIDANEKPPTNRRNQSLVKQGVTKDRAKR